MNRVGTAREILYTDVSMKRQYDPQLIWGYLTRYAEQKFPDRPPGSRIQVFFYLKNKEGAYYLNNGPKLYWDEKVGDPYFVKCDPGSLETNADHLREVLTIGLKKNPEDVGMFPSFEEFLHTIGLK